MLTESNSISNKIVKMDPLIHIIDQGCLEHRDAKGSSTTYKSRVTFYSSTQESDKNDFSVRHKISIEKKIMRRQKCIFSRNAIQITYKTKLLKLLSLSGYFAKFPLFAFCSNRQVVQSFQDVLNKTLE